MNKYIVCKLVDENNGNGIKLIANDSLKTDKPSVSSEMVDNFIKDITTITLGDKTTVTKVTCKNGFVFVESSSSVSPENYDVELGEKICLERIKGQIWSHLVFLLQTAVSD